MSEIKGHTDFVNTVCKLDDYTVVSGSNDGTVKVWDIKTHECLFTLNTGGYITTLCTLPEDRIVSGGLYLKVFEKIGGNYIEKQYGEKENEIIHNKTAVRGIKSICALPNNEMIVTAPNMFDTDTDLDIWNIHTGGHIHTIKTGHTHGINSVYILKDMYIVTASSDGIVKLWDFDYTLIDSLPESTYTPINSDTPITNPVNAVCGLSDGRIVTGSEDGKLRIWNEKDDVRLFKGHALGIMSVCTFTDNYIITASHHPIVKMWDIESEQEVLKLQAPTIVTSVCVLGDRYIVAGLINKNLIVWELKKNYTLTGGLRKLRKKRKTRRKQRILLNKTRNLKRK